MKIHICVEGKIRPSQDENNPFILNRRSISAYFAYEWEIFFADVKKKNEEKAQDQPEKTLNEEK